MSQPAIGELALQPAELQAWVDAYVEGVSGNLSDMAKGVAMAWATMLRPPQERKRVLNAVLSQIAADPAIAPFSKYMQDVLRSSMYRYMTVDDVARVREALRKAKLAPAKSASAASMSRSGSSASLTGGRRRSPSKRSPRKRSPRRSPRRSPSRRR